VLAETAATTAAVRETKAEVVTAGDEIAQTFFFSTSGGRTATNEEAFGGTPLTRSVARPVPREFRHMGLRGHSRKMRRGAGSEQGPIRRHDARVPRPMADLPRAAGPPGRPPSVSPLPTGVSPCRPASL